jgi:hypothetical protein
LKVSTTPLANMATSTLPRAAFLLSCRASGANIQTSPNNCLAVVLAPVPVRILAVAGVALVGAGVLGGASPWPEAGGCWSGGGLAMAATAAIGRLVGAVGL